ncbi:MAG: 4Fe-4S binding protein [Planctomycetes bacterium]|jgi:ferredoxin|nr:4Fe-4S binding protein [Planctomycetota bacterium]
MPKKKSVLHLFRRVSQFFFLFALNPYFFVYRGVCFPAMNCWACPAAAFGCPVGAIGQFLVRGIFPFVTVALILVAGVFIGRMICGWVCPFGLLQDLMAKITKVKIGLPKAVSYLKYAVLAVMVFYVPLAFGRAGVESPAFFCTYCPAGTLEAAIPVRLFGSRFPAGEAVAAAPAAGEAEAPAAPPAPGDSFGAPDLWGEEDGPVAPEAAADWLSGDGAPPPGQGEYGVQVLLRYLATSPKAWVLLGFLVLFVLMRRPFCRGICPIGAMFALLNRFSLFRLRVRKETCKSCNLCAKSCPVDNKVYCSPSSDDCIRCLECVDNCKRGGVKAGLISALPREDYWE